MQIYPSQNFAKLQENMKIFALSKKVTLKRYIYTSEENIDRGVGGGEEWYQSLGLDSAHFCDYNLSVF